MMENYALISGYLSGEDAIWTLAFLLGGIIFGILAVKIKPWCLKGLATIFMMIFLMLQIMNALIGIPWTWVK